MVTCRISGKKHRRILVGADGNRMSVEMTAGVLVANLLEGIEFGLGPTIAVKKEALARIGGYQALGDYFANDFMIGQPDRRSPAITSCFHNMSSSMVVNQKNFQVMWDNQFPLAKSTRYSRRKGIFGSGLIFALPYGLLGLVAAIALGKTGLGLALLGAALLKPHLGVVASGLGRVRDPVP